MSVKLHFLRSHFDNFPKNCGDFSEEKDERFHKDIHVMEACYQGRRDVKVLDDYCWNLKGDTEAAEQMSKYLKRSFDHE